MHIYKKRLENGFTIVEMMVVVVVIGILASLTVFGFNNWQQGLAQRQVQSDLRQAAVAMENAKNFGNGYPNSIPATYKGSSGVTITYVGGNATTYCLQGVSNSFSSIIYSIDTAIGTDPQSGACGSAYQLSAPSPIISGSTSTSLTVTWPAVSGATSYAVKYGTSSPSTTAPCTSSPCVLTGLASSTSYQITVTATSQYNTATSSILNGTTKSTAIATYKALDANYTGCAIAVDNNAYCWGYNTDGQIGNGTSGGNSATITGVSTAGALAGKTVTQISGHSTNICAIASDNYAYCWGRLTGNGTSSTSNVPVAVDRSGVLAGKTVKSISAGGGPYTACVIASDNLPYCWGYNGNGQAGDGTSGNTRLSPVAVNMSGVLAGKTVKQISVGLYHTCVIASDNLPYCWGSNYAGTLGNGNTTDSPNPVAVTMSGVLAGKTVKQIAAGGYETCVIASDNKPYCWGYGQAGRLGNGGTADSSVPVAVSTTSGSLVGKTVSSISLGYSADVCVVATDASAHCWGSNGAGQLGNNSVTDSSVPVAVYTGGALSGKTALAIAAGDTSTCELASDSKIYCWGNNQYSIFGSTSPATSSVAIQLPDINI